MPQRLRADRRPCVHHLRLALGVTVYLAAGAALAYPAVVTTDVNLRAGPDTQFPVARVLSARTPVEVLGCVSDYRWCDVQAGPWRGWVNAEFLWATYESSNVVVAERGPELGLPVLAFVIGAYWGAHYRDRDWYDRWRPWHDWHYRPRPPGWRPPAHPPGWRPPPPAHPPGWRPPPPRPPQARPPELRPPQGGASPRPPARPQPNPTPGGPPPRPRPGPGPQ